MARVYIVFDGPSSHSFGRFVKVEAEDGKSVRTAAKWVERSDGKWTLGPFEDAPTSIQPNTSPASEAPFYRPCQTAQHVPGQCESCKVEVPVDQITSAGGHFVGGAPADHCGPVTLISKVVYRDGLPVHLNWIAGCWREVG